MSKLLDDIQWHPGFYSAAELELRQDKDVLEFNREYSLSKKPLSIDVLIVKKCADVTIKNEIGRIFKTYNVFEYKNPKAGMSIDDYYKTIAYACLFKSQGETVNERLAEEITVSMFRDKYPKGLMDTLKQSGALIEEKFPGIYYISGNTLFKTQIVVTGQLEEKEHSSLRILSDHAKEEDIQKFLTESEKLNTPGDRNNVDAVLQVSMAANRLAYEKVKGICGCARR
jgi:hypothetical protein